MKTVTTMQMAKKMDVDHDQIVSTCDRLFTELEVPSDGYVQHGEGAGRHYEVSERHATMVCMTFDPEMLNRVTLEWLKHESDGSAIGRVMDEVVRDSERLLAEIKQKGATPASETRLLSYQTLLTAFADRLEALDTENLSPKRVLH